MVYLLLFHEACTAGVGQ